MDTSTLPHPRHDIRDILGRRLAATDGEIGTIGDVLFDENTWVARFLVAATGTWLADRQVLFSPFALGPITSTRLGLPGPVITVGLSRADIEGGPFVAPDQAITQDQEFIFHRHYGWPFHPSGGSTWDAVGSVTEPDDVDLRRAAGSSAIQEQRRGVAKQLLGFVVVTPQGVAGTVKSLLIDAETWKIDELVLEMGQWYARKAIRLRTADINHINTALKTIETSVSRNTLRSTKPDTLATQEP